MRSLDECKAEIFRRSEIKIKQRKKTRNRILAACIPLCLCIGIGTVGFAADGFGAKSENMAAAPESAYMIGGFSSSDKESFQDSSQTTSANQSGSISGSCVEEAPDGTPPAGVGTKEIVINRESYFIGENYETLKDILTNLTYSPHKVCRCLPQYKLETDFGSYGIHLSEGYARCDAGQADLTAEQIQTLRQIINNLTDQ